jgi:hypothetical protein
MEKPDDYYERLAEEYKKTKEAIEMLTKRQNDFKAELIQAIKEKGYEDDKGHLWYKAGLHELKYERRVSRTFDIASAEQWARDNELWDRLKMVVEQLDEDALLALAWEDENIADMVSGFYGEKETWAFKA